MSLGKIGKDSLVPSRIDVELKPGLRTQGSGDDLSPDAGKGSRGQVAFVAFQQPPQNGRFPRRPQRRHQRTIAIFRGRLLDFSDGVGDLHPAHEKIMQGVIDFIDLAPEIFERIILLSHRLRRHRTTTPDAY